MAIQSRPANEVVEMPQCVSRENGSPVAVAVAVVAASVGADVVLGVGADGIA